MILWGGVNQNSISAPINFFLTGEKLNMEEAYLCDGIRTPVGRYGESYPVYAQMILRQFRSKL